LRGAAGEIGFILGELTGSDDKNGSVVVATVPPSLPDTEVRNLSGEPA
jgi:hypothetical protein